MRWRSGLGGGEISFTRSALAPLAHKASAVEVSQDVEFVVDGGVCGEEPLGGCAGLRLLLPAPSSPDREMRVLRAIVLSQSPCAMQMAQVQVSERCAV